MGIDPTEMYQRSVVPIRSGDVLLCATDGLIEAMNFQEEQFGIQRVRQAACAAVNRGDGAAAIAKHVLWEMRRFAGLQDRLDDVTLVVVRVL